MHPDFESEFGKFRFDYPGGAGRFEYQIPLEQIGRFNELTRDRSWIDFVP
jgi:hypothetical protein